MLRRLSNTTAILVLLVFSLSSRAGAQGNDGGVQVAKGLPAPRTADGHIDFSGVYHAPGYGPGDPVIRGAETIARNIARGLKPDDVPMLPSAIELMRQRNAQNSKDDPEGLCLPMGTPRKDPYPWKIVQTPQLFLILYEGNVHSYRQVFLDGRAHDPNVTETWWGDSIGKWDGDTLVVDTVGLNDKAWLDLIGHPRTEKAHIIERFTRPELGRVNIEITIDDPGAYSKPWKVFESAQLAPDWELQEYICNENNRDASHLVGK
jgi:hypothetical protein